MQIIFWRFALGVVTPGVFASAVAYIHEVWPASHAGRATAAYLSGTILGGFTGRVVAGLMAADVNWQAAFIALGMLNGVVAIALAIWLPREQRHETRRGAGEAGGSVAAHFRNKRLATTYLVGFSVLFTQVAMFTYVTFYLAAPPFSLSTVALGWLFVVYLLGAVVTPISGYWIDRYGHRTSSRGCRRSSSVFRWRRQACSSRKRRRPATSAR